VVVGGDAREVVVSAVPETVVVGGFGTTDDRPIATNTKKTRIVPPRTTNFDVCSLMASEY
jgi:hypothetical protein